MREFYKGYEIVVEKDKNTESPREWNPLGKMICFFNIIGDEHDMDRDDFNSWAEIEAEIIKKYEPVVIFPVYMYHDSIISISLSPLLYFDNSEIIGFIFCSYERAKKEYTKITSPKVPFEIKDEIIKTLKKEVDLYDHYIREELYFYTIKNPEGHVIGQHFTYFSAEEAMKEAKEALDFHKEQDKE